MNKIIILFLVQAFCAAGFAENLRFTEPFATHIPTRADLDVRWNAPTNKIPSSIWAYHLLPRKLSPQAMSNLLAACSFTSKDGTNYGVELDFKSSDGRRKLRIFPPWGVIEYRTPLSRSLTNLVKDVPSNRQALKLAKKFLSEMDINLSDIGKNEKGSSLGFQVFEWGATYFVNRKAIHNTESREVRFGRAVDGISFISVETGGNGEIHFGSHGKISEIYITWRNMERDKLHPTVTPEMMVKSIREGKAIQGMVPDAVGSIDWPTVKSVTIKEAKPLYFAE